MITKYFSGGYTTVKNEVKSLESDEEQEQKFQPGGSNLKQVHEVYKNGLNEFFAVTEIIFFVLGFSSFRAS